MTGDDVDHVLPVQERFRHSSACWTHNPLIPGPMDRTRVNHLCAAAPIGSSSCQPHEIGERVSRQMAHGIVGLSWGRHLHRAGEAVDRTIAGRCQDHGCQSGGLRRGGSRLIPAPGACRQCTRVAVATTVPHVIALGSIGGLRASSIVMPDGGGP